MRDCPWCGVLLGEHEPSCRTELLLEIRLLHALVQELDAREPDPQTVAVLRTQIKNCRRFA